MHVSYESCLLIWQVDMVRWRRYSIQPNFAIYQIFLWYPADGIHSWQNNRSSYPIANPLTPGHVVLSSALLWVLLSASQLPVASGFVWMAKLPGIILPSTSVQLLDICSLFIGIPACAPPIIELNHTEDCIIIILYACAFWDSSMLCLS